MASEDGEPSRPERSRQAAAFAVAGGTRGSGLAFVAAATAVGHPVAALARGVDGAAAVAAAGGRVVPGDAMVPGDLERLCRTAGPGAVAVSFLGSRPGEGQVDSTGNIAFIDAAVAAGLTRFVLVTSLGCGESLPLLSPRMREVIGAVVAEKTKAEEHLRAAPIGRITRGELARLVLIAATDPQWRGRVLAAQTPVKAAA